MYTIREAPAKTKYSGNTKREQLWHRVEVIDAKGEVWCIMERQLLREAMKAAKMVVRVMNAELF